MKLQPGEAGSGPKPTGEGQPQHYHQVSQVGEACGISGRVTFHHWVQLSSLIRTDIAAQSPASCVQQAEAEAAIVDALARLLLAPSSPGRSRR
jgi:hypothetical protein